jgi:hypothetical protein
MVALVDLGLIFHWSKFRGWLKKIPSPRPPGLFADCCSIVGGLLADCCSWFVTYYCFIFRKGLDYISIVAQYILFSCRTLIERQITQLRFISPILTFFKSGNHETSKPTFSPPARANALNPAPVQSKYIVIHQRFHKLSHVVLCMIFFMMWEREQKEKKGCCTKQPLYERNNHLIRQLNNYCTSCCHATYNIFFLYINYLM